MAKLIVHNARVFTGTSNDYLERSGLFSVDGIIQAVAPDSKLPTPDDETTVVDASGAVIIPGLINCHVHISRRHIHRYPLDRTFRGVVPGIESQNSAQRILFAMKNAWHELMEGTTVFRDTGSRHQVSLELRKAISSGKINGPWMLSCGEGIAMTGGHGTHRDYTAIEADGVDAVRKEVRSQLRAGVDWIKLMASGGLGGMPESEDPRWCEYSIEEMAVAVEEAHKRWKKVCTHCGSAESVKNSVKAGVDSIEHGMLLDEEAVAMMKDTDTSYVPTLHCIYSVYAREEYTAKSEFSEFLKTEVCAPHREGVKMAYEAGVVTVTGTDTLGNMVEEMKMLEDICFKRDEALQAATKQAACAMGIDDKVGTLEAGKLADFVLIDGSPLDSLDALYNVKSVYKTGNRVTYDWLVNLPL